MVDLAVAAVALLSPWLAKAGEGAAKKLGEQAVERMEKLFGVIKAKFSADGDSLTLLRLQQPTADEKVTSEVTELLSKKMSTDPKFADEVRRLVAEAKSDPSVSQFLTQVYGGQVDKIINIGTAGDVTIS
jgi:hypothetical protein